ncbi:rhomboid family intramembrane serine protease [Bosea minatitlanensis]|uniref:Rhomboid family intramembrane serine protease n=1 Tax=Bosea minatitlanensis TaxID=128782 RepID=A0ABW0F3M8_9HYPH|nr:rhomboid family intramembrane serine protease [Bosea minatitlanensis]MCT4494118.1 rhomboid family intramembrane serine protease [Bosea minatitlanensis]
MFVPIYDGVPLRFTRSAFITYGLVAACTAIQLLLRFGPQQESEIAVMAGFGLIPSVLFGTAVLPEGLTHAPAWLTPFSNILLHASFAHLLGNLLFLWVFGDNVEDAMGHARFLAFFFLCGLGGSLAHALAYPASEQPLVGASGAISGVIAAYLMLYPRVRVWGLAFKWIPVHIPAVYTLGGWIVFQAASAWFDPQGDIGWWAHLGGLATGAVLTPLFIRRGVALFGRRSARP